MDIINLFIHEAGHFFFKIFGKTLYFLGGSLLQIILPLLLFITTIKNQKFYSILTSFWAGESLINVSIYIKDAPYKQLKLISKNLIHDWNWILKNNLELSAPLATFVFITGLLFCIYSLIIGFYLIYKNIK